ncbi:hypothetical protein C4559_03580 [Candidatus Microgenomates bacterium]|nr:MAG: hypothetical protein C4559_03580 [Candidatus Microgenomates bacterium]
MKNLKDIIKQAIDIHFHIGPEIIPRKFTVDSLIKAEKGKIGGFVLKNHFYPTNPFIKGIDAKGLKLFGSIVLNNSIGGLNRQAIYSACIISDNPIFVWFPTINAENFLRKNEFEIAPEWVNQKGFKARKAQNIKPVLILENNTLTKEAVNTLKMIKKCEAILATGHISWKESEKLVEQAIKLSIKSIVITHPIYQSINMPIEIQKILAKKGCFIEQSFSMYSIDKIPMEKIAEQIEKVGYKSIILSSDVGQKFSPSASEALLEFATLLKKEGITNKELFEMLVNNPKRLLGID